MPQKKTDQSKTLNPKRSPRWRWFGVKFSIGLNIVFAVLLGLMCFGYASGNGYQTKELAKLYTNQCSHYFDKQTGTTRTVTKTMNGIKKTARIVTVTQPELNTGCYTYIIENVGIAYYQGIFSKYNDPIPVYAGPNGQNLEGVPALNIFLAQKN
jgi:hypothetical protein